MRLGFIGVGNMGRHMAQRLLDAGHELTVHDVLRDRCESLLAMGAMWGANPGDVARASEVTLSVLPGPKEVEEVVLGAEGVLSGAGAGSVYIDMSTSMPAVVQKIERQARALGVDVLDAPVSGGVRGARKGSLVVMAGGGSAVFDRCRPLLEILGSRVIYAGPLGSGYVAKLVNNYMGMANALASMEAMVLGVKAGLDAATLLDIVNSGTGASHMTMTLYPYLIFKRNFDPPRFTMRLGAKDLGLAVELGRELGVPLPIGTLAADQLGMAVDAGRGDEDFSAYVTTLEDAAGVQVKA